VRLAAKEVSVLTAITFSAVPNLAFGRHVVAEAHVAVGMIPELGAVDVDGAVRHDAVEFNEDSAARDLLRKE